VEKAFFKVTVMCRVLNVSKSAYYDWEKGKSRKRMRSDGKLLYFCFTSLSVDTPSVVMLTKHNNDITVSLADPSHGTDPIKLTLDQPYAQVAADDGVFLNVNGNQTIITVDPSIPYGGATKQITLAPLND
jgi:hypothetical protein